MKNFIQQKLNNSPFLRRVGMLVGGTAIAQIIAISTLPILTRLYEPEAFSVLAVYAATLSLLTVNACLRFEIAIPIPKSDRIAAALCILALFSVLIFVLISILAVVLIPDIINRLTNNKIDSVLWLLPIGIFAIGFYNSLQYWSTRKKKFPLISKIRVTQSLTATSVKIIGGYLAGGSPMGLVLGQLLSQSWGFMSLAKSMAKSDLKTFTGLRLKHFRVAINRYDRFPKFSTLEAFANTGGVQISVIVIAYFAVGAEAGYLMIAMQLLSAPMNLIGNAVAQVYLSEGAERYYNDVLKEFTHQTIINLAKIALIPLLIVGFTAPLFSSYLLGEAWLKAGTIMSWMVPWYFMQFITTPVSMSLHITNNQKTAFVLQVFGLILRLGSVLFAASVARNFITEAFAISGFIFYCFYLIVVLKIVATSQSGQRFPSKHISR